MRCPTLKELPPPPPDKKGWPWTEESPQLPEKMPDGSPWPIISIVTPSLNQGQYIEETMRSVLLQGYPCLEYAIIDGKSKDQTVDIIKKYEKWITYWISELDSGQANAINKGFKKVSGDIVAWINSDDFYEMSTFEIAAVNLRKGSVSDFIYGDANIISPKGKIIGRFCTREYSFSNEILYNIVPQQSCFWKHSVFNDIGYLDENYDYIMDFEFWVRGGYTKEFLYIPILMANYRMHPSSKSVEKSIEFDKESLYLYKKLLNDTTLPRNIIENRGKLLREKNERLAMSYYNAKMMKEARVFYVQAILSRFLRIQNITLFAYLIDTYLGSQYGKYLQKLSGKFRSRFPRLSEEIKEKYL